MSAQVICRYILLFQEVEVVYISSDRPYCITENKVDRNSTQYTKERFEVLRRHPGRICSEKYDLLVTDFEFQLTIGFC